MAEMSKDHRQENHAHHRLDRRMEPNRPDRHPLGEGSDEVVRILTKLTDDFERFDTMIQYQRHRLENDAVQSRPMGETDPDSLLFRLEAAELAMRTQKALEQLREVTETFQPRPSRART